MPNPKRENFITTNLRVPRELHRAVKRRAKREEATVNTMYLQLLQDYEVRTLKEITDYVQPLLDGAIERAVHAAGYTAAECLLHAIQEMAPSPSEPELARCLASMETLLREAAERDAFTSMAAEEPD